MKKILLTIFTIFILVGCSTGESTNTPKTTIYNSVRGDVEIPSKPQRIVADYYVGELIKLEANLVGADLTYTSSHWGDISNLVNVGQSMEAIAALEPDLIITINEAYIDQYEVIAPTVYVPYGKYNPEELMLELSTITNTSEIASKWLDDFNSKIDELNALIADKNETWTIMELNGESAYFYGEHYGRAGYIIYNKLDLSSTQKAETEYVRKADSYLNVTVEALPDFIGDNLILVYPDKYQNHYFLNNDVWDSLDAVKNNNVYYVDANDFWFSDPFSFDIQIEKLKEIFTSGN